MKVQTEQQKRQHRMRAAVASLQRYMASYDKQLCFEDYLDSTYINDVLYGLGVSLDRAQYSYAPGFDKFKAFLREHLRESTDGSGDAER